MYIQVLRDTPPPCLNSFTCLVMWLGRWGLVSVQWFVCARGIKINENCNLDGRKIVHNRSLGSPGSSSCGRLPTTQWWVSVSLGSYVSWMVGALFIISVSARSYLHGKLQKICKNRCKLVGPQWGHSSVTIGKRETHKAKPKSKVWLGRWGLVSVQSFVCARGIKIDDNRGLEGLKIV